ncbi:MAG: hypothetical protein V4644_00145 [Patescibacteria group bacterium]
MAATKKTKTTHKRSSKTGRFTLVREISEQYGVEFSGDQNIPLYEHLRKNGNKALGNALEYLEGEVKPA